MKQKGLKRVAAQRFADGVESGLLRQVEHDGVVAVGNRRIFRQNPVDTDRPGLGELARHRRHVLAFDLQRLDVVGAGVAFEKLDQPALAAGQLRRRGSQVDGLDDQTSAAGQQRIAVFDDRVDGQKALALQAAQRGGRVGQLLAEVFFVQRPLFERQQNLDEGVVGGGGVQELAGGVDAFRGQRDDFAGVCFAAQGQHRLEHLAQRRAVVFGDPAAQFEQIGWQCGLLVEQTQHVARRLLGRAAMASQHHARQLARAERRQYARAGLHPVAQRFRQGIRERLIERDGQRDVAER